jgi:hypothetical protein
VQTSGIADIHNATAVEPKWFVEVALHFFKVADQHKIGKRKKQEKIELLLVEYLCESYQRTHSKRFPSVGTHGQCV